MATSSAAAAALQADVKKLSIEDFDSQSKKCIGDGGCGSVYKVRNKKESKFYAIKMIRSSANTKETKKELDVLARIRHKNIIGFFGEVKWFDKDCTCLVLEYAESGDLYKLLHKNKNSDSMLTSEDKEKIIREICSGLKHLHHGLEKPVRHGDIKSPNILLCQDGEERVAKLADFGLSEELTSTKPGDGRRTFRWAAPEILRPQKNRDSTINSTKSDIWAFGVVVWELWMELLPYSNIFSLGSEAEYLILDHVGILKKTPYDPEKDDKVPERYREFLTNCFEFDHKERWTTEEAYCYLMKFVPKQDTKDDGSDSDDLNRTVWTNSELSEAIRDQHTQAVINFTRDLEADSNLFNKVKTLFRVEIRTGVRERLKTPYDLLDQLEKLAILSPLNTAQLEKRLCMLGEVGERLASYFSDTPSVQHSPKSQPPEGCKTSPRGSKSPDYENLTDTEETASPVMAGPPDNFRDYSVAPTQEELEKPNQSVFKRENKVKGDYESVDDYLDVHFRLMREDFLIPLRTGTSILKDTDKKTGIKTSRVRQVHIYRDATVRYPVCLRNGIGHVVSFDITRCNSSWERNKKLLYGSLLCFYSEDYTRSLLATVANRDTKALRHRGEITVQFISGSEIQSTSNEKFILVESSAYFEAYRHVLTRLQALTEATFPLTKHIVFCNQKVEAPDYLLRNEHQFNFQCITEEENDTEMRVNPLDLEAWPSKEELEIDDSQYLALKTAITHRIALIQGPPGAGKTFMGLKITKLLLENVVKPKKNFGPILVISYTNHALDQFLEAIADFPDVKIVRIGSQSKSETVKKFTLTKVRQEYVEGRRFSSKSSREFSELRSQIRQLDEEFMDNSAKLRATGEHVVNLTVLKEHANVQIDHFVDIVGSAKTGRQIHNKMKEWLSETLEEEIAFPEGSPQNLIKPTKESTSEATTDEDDDESDCEDVMIETTRRKLEGDDEKTDADKRYLQKIKDCLGEDLINWDPKSTKREKELQSKVLHQFLESDDCMSEEEEKKLVQSPRQLPPREKWRLYRLWRHRYRLSLHSNLKDLKVRYDAKCRKREKLEKENDHSLFAEHQVIAMTTTGAARYGEILSALKPKIVIVEEAAEVFESHVVTALSESCEHLILIGDHKQLRPKCTTYEIAEAYRLDVSLFERLILNDFHYNTLGLQHRMRPEIADLLRQEKLYPNLEDHNSVMRYRDIEGVADNLFFLSHQHEETRDELSFSNDFEARYADRLCKHLLMQGYEPKNITILTLYSGQQHQLTCQRTISEKSCKGLKVTVVDNYQGEENDIIILSLVRSNEQKEIGFAIKENRICVAMSRARKGLYVLGNIPQFTAKSSLWANIVKKAEERNQVGSGLQIICQLHPEDEPMTVTSMKDFDEHSPDGGCSRPCDTRLECGHLCSKKCHPTDQEHKEYKCQELVDVDWKHCDHRVPCFKASVPERSCKEDCKYILDCGHLCPKKCGEPHASSCSVMMHTISPFCGHEVPTPCGGSKDKEVVCRKPCKEKLSCDHMCAGFCSKCCEGRIHEACSRKCNHTLVCGHECNLPHRPRRRECPPCQENCELHCEHVECRHPCSQRCTPCRKKCVNRCPHQECSKLCHENCDAEPCDQPCIEQFFCTKCKKEVDCLGLCGEKCIELCRSCDAPQLSRLYRYLNLDEKDGLREARFLRLETCGDIFEVSSLDKWIRDDSAASVGVKRCPRCKSTITLRSCKRYMNQVRKGVAEMRDVNDAVDDEDKLDIRRENLLDELNGLNLKNISSLTEQQNFLQSFRTKARKAHSAFEIFHYEGVVSLLQDLENQSEKFAEARAEGLEEDFLNGAKHSLDGLLSAFSRPMTSEVLEQCRMETLRFADLRRIFQLICRFHSHSNHREASQRLWTECISDWTSQFNRQTHEKIVRKIEKLERKAEAENE